MVLGFWEILYLPSTIFIRRQWGTQFRSFIKFLSILRSRHLKEVTKNSSDIPAHVMEKIKSELSPSSHSLNFYYDYLPYDTATLTWDAEHRQNKVNDSRKRSLDAVKMQLISDWILIFNKCHGLVKTPYKVKSLFFLIK